MTCADQNKYNNNGRCCDLCSAGSYKQADCDDTKETECAVCGRGLFTATKNYLNKCHHCKICNSNNHLRKIKECTAQENTVCECEPGYYCSDDNCDHCQIVKYCPQGEGVKFLATRTNDTVCSPCEEGTYSNVTDYLSPCQAHTRCSENGRVLKTPGTQTTDAICGDFIQNCHWMLPAVLWSGLVLTALVLFGLIYWRKKCKSYGEGSTSDPVTFVDVVPAAPDGPLGLTLPSMEANGHCQESCTTECYSLLLFNPDVDTVVSCSTQDSVENSLPITPLKASVSFAESNPTSAGYSNFLRTYSEPQEDEYCGT